MKNLSILVLIFVLSVSTTFANATITAPSKKKKKSNTKCMMTTKNDLLKAIISYGEIKKYFDISTRRGNDIKVFENEYIDQSTNVSINYQKVLIVNNPSRYPDALTIDFSEIDCDNNAIEFVISSRIKGVEMTGGLRNVNNQWELQVFSHKKM